MRESVYVIALACVPLEHICHQFKLPKFDFLIPGRFVRRMVHLFWDYFHYLRCKMGRKNRLSHKKNAERKKRARKRLFATRQLSEHVTTSLQSLQSSLALPNSTWSDQSPAQLEKLVLCNITQLPSFPQPVGITRSVTVLISHGQYSLNGIILTYPSAQPSNPVPYHESICLD